MHICVHHMGVRTTLSMPTGTFGGPLVPGTDLSTIAGALCRAFLDDAAGWNSRGGQIVEFGNRALGSLPETVRCCFRYLSRTTQVLNLDGGIECVRNDRFEAQRRRQARCARRRGLIVTQAREAADFLEYADLYEEVIRGWDSGWRPSRSFFLHLGRTSLPGVLLLLARHDGQVVAGNLAFLYGCCFWCSTGSWSPV